MTLPDQNRLLRRDLRGFRMDLAQNRNLSPPFYPIGAPTTTTTVPSSSPLSQNMNSNLLSPTFRNNDNSSNDSSQEPAFLTERIVVQQQNMLSQASALRRSSRAGNRTPIPPRASRLPIPTVNLTETLQTRMATNAMAAAARARNLSPKSQF